MLKQYTIICGLNDQTTKKQEVTTEHAKNTIASIILAHTGGATLSECDGIYTHNDGTIVFEKSIKILVCGIKEKEAKRLAVEVKKALNQESIYYCNHKNKVSFL